LIFSIPEPFLIINRTNAVRQVPFKMSLDRGQGNGDDYFG